MVECAPPRKNAEQYPLLMVTGSGDGAGGGPTPTVVSTVWDVTNCAPKHSWRERLPEFLSICWMTFILLGISFLVFYVIGILAYSQQPFIFIKCNNSKPASDVYYHHIIPHGGHISFMVYSEYLSHMAMQYPLLRFNVLFLMDDKFQSALPPTRNPGFYSKLMPIPYYTPKLYNEITKREMRLFQERYPNVNITVMPLSTFMTMTPLKYKWRAIPSFQLAFYARIFSVWRTGGIGIDLTTFTNQYNNNQLLDRRMSAILKQHNDGIKTEGYADILNKIDRDDENKFLMLFYGLINEILNETRSFFNKSFPFNHSTEGTTTMNNSLIRTHRSKRDMSAGEVMNISDNKQKDATSAMNLIPENTTVANLTVTAEANANLITDQANVSSVDIQENDTATNLPANANYTKSLESEKPISEIVNKTDTAQVVMIYDVSLIAGGNWVADFFLGPMAPPEFREFVSPKNSGFNNSKNAKGHLPLLSIESDGMFVAATSQLHPFLGYLLCSDGRLILPKFTIQDALFTQCSGIFRNDMYCNNIYVLEF